MQNSNSNAQIKLTTEAEFYDFLDELKKNEVWGISRQLSELSKCEITDEIRQIIYAFYSADAQNNHFDREALKDFLISGTQTAEKNSKINQINDAMKPGCLIEGLKFLKDNEKFKDKDKGLGEKYLTSESWSYDDRKFIKQLLKRYQGILPDDQFQEIQNYRPVKPNREKQSTKAIEGLEGQFFSTPQGPKFYSEAGISLEIDSDSFEGLIADRKYQSGEGIPTGDEIASVRRLSRYWASKNVLDIGVRSSRFVQGFVYDPVRPDGKVYFITKSGFELKVPERPMTVRYPGMLEAEVQDGTFEDHLSLIRLWNLSKEGEILSMGLDFSRFIADIPHAIENIDGPHGAGKTAYTEVKRSLFDPNGAPTQSLKFDERDISISAMHQGMLAFDNVNTPMPDYISDLICRLTTGQGFRTRELYTNMGEVILKLKKSIMVNGINRSSYKPDYIDRECQTHLREIPEEGRLTDADIRAKAEMLTPKVRGYILSVIPKAIEIYHEVEKELKGRLPRMADFVIWAECGIRAMGFPALSFFNAYTDSKHSEIVDVARESLLINAIQVLIEINKEWKGNATDLLESLRSDQITTESQRKSKVFPQNPTRLGRLLNELIPTLRELGIEVLEDNSDKNNRRKIIKKISQLPESSKVSVGSVGNEIEPTKSDVRKPTVSSETNFSKNLSVGKIEPEESDVQNDTDTTDTKNQKFGKTENKISSEMALKLKKTIEKTFSWKVYDVELDAYNRNFKFRLQGHKSELSEELRAVLDANGFIHINDNKEGSYAGSSWWKLPRDLKGSDLS